MPPGRRTLWVALAAALPGVSALQLPLPITSLSPRTPPSSRTARMQYGQGYGAPQQGYPQQGYPPSQGYGEQQVLWRIYPATGVSGHNMFSGAVSALNRDRFGSVCEKYGAFPYALIANDERILSRWNMLQPVETVSRSQCTVKAFPDGAALLTSQGSCAPTLWRQQGGPWNALYQGQAQYLADGCQVSLDASNPEAAVFTCQQEMGGGYGQQGGYDQYGQQQGGYQQGGYQQQW